MATCNDHMYVSFVGMSMCTSVGGEDCVVLPLSLGKEWGLDVHAVIPLPFLSKTGVPWVLIDPGGIFQDYIETKGEESLISDLLTSLEVYQGELSPWFET
ncbi:hypothetical protein Tco_0292451 [Tanacetum coccineum]